MRDEFGNTLATTLKARQVLRNGQWRNEGFVAERMSAYSATAPRSNAQPEPNGYGYLRAEHGKMRVITGSDGRVITKLPLALARTSELIRHGGLSMTTDAQAQTAKDVKLRKPSTPMVTSTQLTQWKPVIPLPKPIEKMSPVDRAKYMVKEALRVAPASARKELQGLLRPQNLALMAGFAAAQVVPGVNVVVDVVAGLMLGKEVTETGVKIISAIRSGLSTQQPYELVKAGDQLAEAFSHLGVGVGIALIGGVAARGAGKLGTKAAPVEGLPLPRPSKLPGANNIVPFARRPRSKSSGHHPDGSARNLGRPAGSAVATAAAPARARTALATAQSNGIRQQGNQASHTPVPAVPPLPTVRAAAMLPLPLPTVQTLPEDKPQSEKRRGAGAGSSGVPPRLTRTSAEEAKLKAWLTRHGDPLRAQQLNAYREGRISDKEDVLGGRTNADRKDMSAALDKIDRTRIGPSRDGGDGRSHTTAEVKNIWRQIDKRGGVDALPEALLREVTGITEQALKDTRLTPAEHSDFTHRLADARQAQTQYHKARAATKTKPPVDTSGSNLPMGELVFGKPPDPGKSFPGLIQPGGWRRPASLTAPITFTDPLTGAVVERDEPDKMRNGEHVRAQAGDTAPGVSDSLIKGPINPVRTVKTADSSVRLKGRDRRAATSEQSTLGHSNNASVHEALQKAGHSKKAIKTLTSRAAKLRDSGTAAPLPSDGSAQPTSKPGTNPKVVAPISAVDSQLHHPDLQEVQAHFNTTSRSSTENGSMRKIRKAATSIASAQRPGGNAGTLKDGPQLQPGNRSHSSVKLLSSDGGDTFNIVHAANTKIERPLPQRIRDVAEANDIPIEIAQQVRDDFGGPFSSPAMVRYLRSQYPANLTDAAATTLVNTVRSVQNDSTRVIKTLIDAAASRTNWLGLPAAAFSVQEVEGITAAMNAQPLTDSDAARLLYRVVASPDFKPYRGANSLARKEFDGLLNRAGYARVPVSAVWQRPQGALPINHRDTKHTATDPTFARLLAQTGSAQSNTARLGIVDSFSPIKPPTARLSTVYLPGYEPDGIYLKHGHEVASVAIRGLGPWNQAVLATFNGNVETVPAIVDAMALRGIRAVNFSLGPTTSEAGEILLSIFDRHPDVMFVVGAGNDYTDRATLPAYSSVGSTLDNVIYVGSVDRQSKLAKSSNTGQDQLFAFGKDRTVASVKGDEQDYWITTPITKVKSGTSLSGPDVANTLAKMGILNPEMPPVLSKNILFASATRVTQTGPAGRRVESVPVINHEDALTLSALGGLFARQQRPVIGAQVQRDAQTGQSLGRRTWEPAASGQPVTLQDCADILRLKAADRARLLPLADRLFLTGTGR